MIERRPFGRTGHDSTRVIFGAAALGGMSQARADATMELVREAGINHIDTAAGYGQSEVRLQPFLADHRGEFFLATKTGERTGDRRAGRAGALAAADGRRPGRPDPAAQPRRGRRVGRRPRARRRRRGARRRPATRGWCGSSASPATACASPGMHLRSLERFDFDSVLFPYNYALLSRPDYRADVEALLEVCAEPVGGDADDQGRRPAAVAGVDGRPEVQLVRAAARGRRAVTRRRLRARPRAAVPQHHERRPPAAGGVRRGRRGPHRADRRGDGRRPRRRGRRAAVRRRRRSNGSDRRRWTGSGADVRGSRPASGHRADPGSVEDDLRRRSRRAASPGRACGRWRPC